MASATVKKRRTQKAFIKRYLRIMIGAFLILILVVMAVFAPVIATHDPNEIDMTSLLQAPSSEHYFGTDSVGRDVFSRIVYGAQISLLIGLGVQALSILVGTVLGLICGYFRGADLVIMRIMEGLMAMPGLLLTFVMTSVLGTGVLNLIISLSIGRIPTLCRTLRGQVLSLREKEYIESEKAMGATNVRTIFLHILPQCTNYLVLRFTTGISGAIMAISSLAYLGVGLKPEIPNWGTIIAQGQAYLLTKPYLVIYPGIMISITIFGFTMFGEGLREVLDPKLK
jgi:ABC-type dipeptide/oligopeptide/nickel transport system permease subunit